MKWGSIFGAKEKVSKGHFSSTTRPKSVSSKGKLGLDPDCKDELMVDNVDHFFLGKFL